MTTTGLRLQIQLILVLSAVFLLETSAQAADDVGKCYLEKFVKHIGYQGVLSTDANLASLDASLGDEARCRYKVEFSPCIGTAIERLNSAAKLGKTSPATQQAVLKVDVVRRIAEHDVEVVYNVEKAGFFSSPKFSNIRLSERILRPPNSDAWKNCRSGRQSLERSLWVGGNERGQIYKKDRLLRKSPD